MNREKLAAEIKSIILNQFLIADEKTTDILALFPSEGEVREILNQLIIQLGNEARTSRTRIRNHEGKTLDDYVQAICGEVTK